MMEKWKPPLKREASSNSGFFIEASQLVDFSISFKKIVKNTVGKTNKSALSRKDLNSMMVMMNDVSKSFNDLSKNVNNIISDP